MERLTGSSEEIKNLTAENEEYWLKVYFKLKKYEEAEEQGLLIRLPCKCDEVVWVAEKGFTPHKALYACSSAMLDDIERGAGIGYTKEEAEAALERTNENA